MQTGISEPEMTIMIFMRKRRATWMMSVRVPSRKPKRYSKGLNSRKLYTGDICRRMKHLEAGTAGKLLAPTGLRGKGRK